MRSETPKDNEHLLPGAENFSSWYQFLSQEHQKSTHDLRLKISDLFPNFRQLHLPKSGDQRILEAEFSVDNNGSGKSISFRFNELSDGQRALIVLYALLLAAKEADYTLVLDEPENFVGLPELQPWLMELKDLCADSDVQALLISHHPEVIDYLGPEHGVWLERDNGGPTRIKGLPKEAQSGLKLSELIERGWEDNG